MQTLSRRRQSRKYINNSIGWKVKEQEKKKKKTSIPTNGKMKNKHCENILKSNLTCAEIENCSIKDFRYFLRIAKWNIERECVRQASKPSKYYWKTTEIDDAATAGRFKFAIKFLNVFRKAHFLIRNRAGLALSTVKHKMLSNHQDYNWISMNMIKLICGLPHSSFDRDTLLLTGQSMLQEIINVNIVGFCYLFSVRHNVDVDASDLITAV